MAITAPVLQWTSVSVSAHTLVRFPTVALDRCVTELVGCTSKVLPIMRVVATLAVVRLMRLGTPHRFKIEQEEVLVLNHIFEDRDG